MPDNDRNAVPCPVCTVAVGEHTINGYQDCLQSAGFDYQLPMAEVPGGPLNLPGLDFLFAGEVQVRAATIPTGLGTFPLLIFDFEGAGEGPMERVRVTPRPVALLLSADGMRVFAQLVSESVGAALRALKKGAAGGN